MPEAGPNPLPEQVQYASFLPSLQTPLPSASLTWGCQAQEVEQGCWPTSVHQPPQLLSCHKPSLRHVCDSPEELCQPKERLGLCSELSKTHGREVMEYSFFKKTTWCFQRKLGRAECIVQARAQCFGSSEQQQVGHTPQQMECLTAN